MTNRVPDGGCTHVISSNVSLDYYLTTFTTSAYASLCTRTLRQPVSQLATYHAPSAICGAACGHASSSRLPLGAILVLSLRCIPFASLRICRSSTTLTTFAVPSRRAVFCSSLFSRHELFQFHFVSCHIHITAFASRSFLYFSTRTHRYPTYMPPRASVCLYTHQPTLFTCPTSRHHRQCVWG